MSKREINLPKNGFYTTLTFMVTDLKLKGNKLAIFAIIYGFSQAGQGYFEGSYDYLSNWLKCDKRTVRRLVKQMRIEGLLIMEKRGKSKYSKNRINVNKNCLK